MRESSSSRKSFFIDRGVPEHFRRRRSGMGLILRRRDSAKGAIRWCRPEALRAFRSYDLGHCAHPYREYPGRDGAKHLSTSHDQHHGTLDHEW